MKRNVLLFFAASALRGSPASSEHIQRFIASSGVYEQLLHHVVHHDHAGHHHVHNGSHYTASHPTSSSPSLAVTARPQGTSGLALQPVRAPGNRNELFLSQLSSCCVYIEVLTYQWGQLLWWSIAHSGYFNSPPGEALRSLAFCDDTSTSS